MEHIGETQLLVGRASSIKWYTYFSQKKDIINPIQGWNTSADPRRRSFQVKKNETDDMKREMSEIEQRRVMEHREMISEIGTELAPLMKNSITGKPRKDPETGYMMDHSLSSTDVTRLAINGYIWTSFFH